MTDYGALAERYRTKEKYLEKKTIQVPVCPPQIPQRLSWFVAVKMHFEATCTTE
jgi:hypothetical protein